MSVLQTLTLRHLRQNRKRTLITLVAIALSVGMVVAVSGLVVSFQDMMYRSAVAEEGDWHVLYRGLDPALAQQVAGEEPFVAETAYTRTDEDWEGITLVLQFRKLDRHIFQRSEEVCFRYGITSEQVRYHNDLLIAKGLMPGGYFEAIYGFAAVLFVLIAAGSVMVICNAFTISADQRSVQFGLLKSVGATSRQIRGMVFFEGLVLCAMAIPLGILMGLFAEWTALSIANYVFAQNPYVSFFHTFRTVTSPLALGVSVGAAVLTVLLAAWLPARRAARISPVEAIRQTRTVKIKPRSVRVRLPLARLLGFEALLAAKTMKRNRRGYRTTVVSLVVSIGLSIGVSGFGQLLLKATSMVYRDVGSNVSIVVSGGDTAWQDAFAQELAAEPQNATMHTMRKAYNAAYLPADSFTSLGREYFGNGEYEVFNSVHLYSIQQAEYEALCASLGLDPNALADPDNPQGILINTTGTFIREGRYTDFAPYALGAGDHLVLEDAAELGIAGTVSEIPAAVMAEFSFYAVSVIVPEPVRAALDETEREPYLLISVMAEDADAFEAFAYQFMEERLPQWGSFSLTNYEALARGNRSFGYLVMTFVYGFIAMLSLIAVTSVITTISTGVALRSRELAMLRSVGMTGKAQSRMLGYESLLYALKALVIGIPLGLAACVLMYLALGGALEFEFQWPVSSIAISVAATLLLSFATTALARKKQGGRNIVEALRNDVI